MTTAAIQPATRPWQLRGYLIFSLLGWIFILAALIIGAGILAPNAANYFGANSKAIRDGAEAGTALLAQLQLLRTIPLWLEPLVFLGVASFMTGIALEFSSIPKLLENRGQVMSICFPVIARLNAPRAEVPEDPKPFFLYRFVEWMMPAWPVIAVMGWMLVGISFLIGLYVLSPAQATFFSDAKTVREAAAAGSAFVAANVAIHSIEAWLPQLKLFGLGLGLLGIVMALGTISKKLRHMGKVITVHIPDNLRPATPPIPRRVRVFQLSTLMGIMVLMIVLIIGIVLAAGVVPSYWNNSIANDLNPAAAGSALLAQLSVVASYASWLNPLRMFGMAFLFTGITIALTVIIGTLLTQSKLLTIFYQDATAASGD